MGTHSSQFRALVDDAKSRIKETSVAEVKSRLDSDDDFFLIDVREESEYAAGHLPKALQIGKGILERDIEKIIPRIEAQIILYCGGGFRSALAADALGKMGYENVYSVAGGYRDWHEAGYAVVHDE